VGWEGRPTAEEVGRPRRCVTKRATILRGEFSSLDRGVGDAHEGEPGSGRPGRYVTKKRTTTLIVVRFRYSSLLFLSYLTPTCVANNDKTRKPPS
jgi:hypothetical protein